MSEKEASNVITADNAAEFYAQKLGLTNEPPAEAVVEETPTEPTEEVENEPVEHEEAKTTEKKKSGIDKRFKELTSEREMARQEAERERQARVELENRLKDYETRTEQAKNPQLDAEPQPAQFNDLVEYYKALSEWNTDKAMRERDDRERQSRLNAEKERVMSTFNERQDKFKQENPDYVEKVSQLQFPASEEVQDAILTSDYGAEVLYHLGKNPDLAKKIVAMPLTKALKELGKIEAQFESKPDEKPVVSRSNAPKPITPLRATSAAADTPIGSDGQFHGSYQQWKEARKAGKIR